MYGNYYRGFFNPKTMIYIAVGLSIFTSVLLAVAGFMLIVSTSTFGDVDENSKLIMQLFGTLSLAMGASTFTRSIITISFMKSLSDDEIYANRWAIIILLIGVSSVWLPMIIKSTRGLGAESDDSRPVKFLIGKWYSMITLVFGLAGLLGIGVIATQDKTFITNSFSSAKDTVDQAPLIILYALLAIFALTAVVGLLTVPAFYAKGSQENYVNKTGSSVYLKLWAGIFTIWCTFLLIISIFVAILNIISALASLFTRTNSNGSRMNGLEVFFNMMFRVPFIFLTQGYIIWNYSQTIKGVWSKNETVTYRQYDKLFNYHNNRSVEVE